MMSSISFEGKRVFAYTVLACYFTMLIASLYFTSLGIGDYKEFFEKKEHFLQREAAQIKLYINYEQYGAAGFRVLLQPSALAIFFNRFNVVQNLEATIDTSEILKIYNNRSGQNIYTSMRFGDLSQIVGIFGTLFMMILGFLTFPAAQTTAFFTHRHFLIHTIVARLLIGLAGFILLFLSNYSLALFMRMHFTPVEKTIFFQWCGTMLLILVSFFLVGLSVRIAFGYKKQAAIALSITWFFIVFVIPSLWNLQYAADIRSLPTRERIELEKLEVLSTAERKMHQSINRFIAQNPKMEPGKLLKISGQLFNNYMNTGYKVNKKSEEAFQRLETKIIEKITGRYFFSPIDFIYYNSAEVAGVGYGAYFDFLHYLVKLKNEFMRFYGQKRYVENGYPPVPFLKKGANIFQAQPHLPAGNLGRAAVATGIMLLIYIGLFLINRKKKKAAEIPDIPPTIAPQHMLFLLVNKDRQAALYEGLKQKGFAFLDKDTTSILTTEVRAECFIDFCCREKQIEKQKVYELSELLDVPPAMLKMRIGNFDLENKKKLISSIVFAGSQNIVINDFLKDSSLEFERRFLQVVCRLAGQGRYIIYLSSHMYSPAFSFESSGVVVDNYQGFLLEPDKISLR